MTLRVLFVDDDTAVLAGLRRLLRPMRGEWDVVLASSGRQALAEMQAGPFDVIVTDMRMPQMDGNELLGIVRDRYPDVLRVVLSVQAELAAALRSVPVAHQSVRKPCDIEALRDTLRRGCAMQARLRSVALRRTLGQIDALPSPPASIIALNKVLGDPDASVADVVRIVAGDVAMAAKILQIVNSAFFGLATRVESVRQAVSYLGLETVRNLAATVEAFRSMEGRGGISAEWMGRFTAHSAQVGSVAAELLPDEASGTDALIAAMLHDVGILALAAGPGRDYRALLSEARTSGRSLHVVEAERLGATHADIGGYLLSLWGLPYSIIEPVLMHHTPPPVSSGCITVAHATYLADFLVNEAEARGEGSVEGAQGALDPGYLDSLGVRDRVARLRAQLAASASASAA